MVAFDRAGQQPDALTVLDTDPGSDSYGQIVGWVDLDQTIGDELHHFGWNACSSALKHEGHDMGHDGLQRRYLLLPGLRSSNVHVYDTQPDPRSPVLHKMISAEELAEKAGYSRPHTLHCGPDGVFLTCLGRRRRPGGPRRDRAARPQHVRRPPGLGDRPRAAVPRLRRLVAPQPEHAGLQRVGHAVDDRERARPRDCCSAGKYGHRLHFWDLAEGRHLQTVDLGAEQQMVLELRPSHDPEATWGFVGVVVSTADLSASVWRWHRDGGEWTADKVITIPAEPADPADLPPALAPFGAVPPLITDIDLSVDDQMLYVSCWGTGELKQFDVSDPAHPREVGSIHLGGVVRKTPHPAAPGEALAGGPQMVEVSRDGRRIYVTNSLYGAWDDQFFPSGVGSWMAKIDTDPSSGGLTLDERFFPHGDDWRGLRPHQTRLQGGDASQRLLLLPLSYFALTAGRARSGFGSGGRGPSCRRLR